MYCEKCHYGSEIWKPYENRCSMCGHTKILEKNPLPNSPVHSIRAMNKRKDEKRKFKKNELLHSEIEGITGKLKARDYSDGM